jgi:hypothetical protein
MVAVQGSTGCGTGKHKLILVAVQGSVNRPSLQYLQILQRYLKTAAGYAQRSPRLSPEQKQFLADIRALGGLAVVAKSCRDIEAALLEAGYGGLVAGPLFEGGDN